MTDTADFDGSAYAALLADSLRDVAADLRTIDLIDLVSYIRFGSYTALDDLIQSSVELFFKHGTLTSAWTACVDMAWDVLPVVTLGLEFRHPSVSVFFDLMIDADGDDVAVRAVVFEDPMEGDAGGLDLLAGALAETRLPLRAAGRTGPASRLPWSGQRLLPR